MNKSKWIGLYKEYGIPDAPSIRSFFCPTAYEGEDKVIHFLESGQDKLASPRSEKDFFTGEPVPYESLIMTDGTYCWCLSLAYYVKKYHLRFPKEVENYILESNLIKGTA